MQLVKIETQGNSISIRPKYNESEKVGCTGVCLFSQFEPYYQISCNKNFSSVHYENEVYVLCENEGTCIGAHRDSPKPEIRHDYEPLIDEQTVLRDAEFMGIIGFPVISCPSCPVGKVCWSGDALHDDVSVCVCLHRLIDMGVYADEKQILKAACTFPHICNHETSKLVEDFGVADKNEFNNLIK